MQEETKWEKFCDFMFDITPGFLYRFYCDWLKPCSIRRKIKFFIQRCIRGFDDSETWNLDSTLYNWLLPRLKRFKEVTSSYPGCYKSLEEWKDEIQKGIDLLEYISDEENFYHKDFEDKEDEFLNWFCDKLHGLWW